MVSFFRSFMLQTKLILLICCVLTLALLSAHLFVSRSIENQVRQNLLEKADGISRVVADSPTIIRSLENPDNYRQIQDYAQQVRNDVQVEFVVVFDMNGTRLSHPDRDKIGQHLVGGDELPVLQGKAYISNAQGTLGPSLRAFRPIFNEADQQIGGVVVGILLSDIDLAIHKSNLALLSGLSLALLIGIIAAFLFGKSIKNTLLGLEPDAIAQMTEERNAILQSVREGIIAINQEGILTVVNQEAQRIFASVGVTENLIGKKVEDHVPHTRLLDIVKSGKAEFDQEQDLNGVVIWTNRVPLVVNGEIVGAIATFRDLTEVRKLAEELTGVNRYVEALRPQAHEFLNKLHVICGLSYNKKYEELSQYIHQVVGDNQRELEFVDRHVEEPVISAFLHSKLSRSRELGLHLYIRPQSYLPLSPNSDFTHGMITILGNLLDNAMDAVQNSPKKEIYLLLAVVDHAWYFEVCDSGPGIDPENIDPLFIRGYSTKGEERGLGLFLVSKIVEKYQGHIEVTSSPEQVGTCFKIEIPLPEKGG